MGPLRWRGAPVTRPAARQGAALLCACRASDGTPAAQPQHRKSSSLHGIADYSATCGLNAIATSGTMCGAPVSAEKTRLQYNEQMGELPKKVRIVEVGPRDGLQNEQKT